LAAAVAQGATSFASTLLQALQTGTAAAAGGAPSFAGVVHGHHRGHIAMQVADQRNGSAVFGSLRRAG